MRDDVLSTGEFFEVAAQSMTARSIRIISPYDSDLFRQIPNTTTIAGQAHGAAYDLGIGSNFQPRSPTAMTASVRLDTSNALRIAVTWFFTVGSAKLRTRPIALLLFPSIISDSTSTCRSVRPRSAGQAGGRLATGGFSSCPTRGSFAAISSLRTI